MKSVIKVSKTVEEAVKEALIELDAREEDVEIEVLEESSKGFFGLIGVKDAKVKVTLTYDPVEIVDSFLTKVLSLMGINGVCVIDRQDDVLNVDITDISSSDMGIIIGKRGNTLDSIQYLANLAINKDREDYMKVMLDTNNYRKKREETLERLALRMADKAKKSKRPVKLEPMNPYERRLIHSALQKREDITTFSEGKEPYRRVVIQTK